MKASFFKHVLNFNSPSGTSRGVLKTKTSWFIIVTDQNKTGVGECSLIDGLSPDPQKTFEKTLFEVCENINLGLEYFYKNLISYPSILFGLETAFLSLKSKNSFELYPSCFTQHEEGIPINGLVWMGDKKFMYNQILEKINSGFDCIKIKIGALDFKTEIDLLKNVRKEFSTKDIEIRVDANCAFSFNSALEKLKILSDFSLHSIEQPIKIRQWENMAYLCENSPLDIALDEELVGLPCEDKEDMISTINPKYIILKPSLIGGIRQSEKWISLAKKNKINWWVTSALESNVGLNAISQWVFNKSSHMKQGLGTGQLFSNNILSPLYVKDGSLSYDSKASWDLTFLNPLSLK